MPSQGLQHISIPDFFPYFLLAMVAAKHCNAGAL
jgi:hypothetical protein